MATREYRPNSQKLNMEVRPELSFRQNLKPEDKSIFAYAKYDISNNYLGAGIAWTPNRDNYITAGVSTNKKQSIFVEASFTFE